MEATGSCAGIENYSRYLTGRKPGEPPPYPLRILARQRPRLHRRIARYRAADRRHVPRRLRRKATLAGIRLPPALLLDNRPLRFEEWEAMRPQTVHVSATPGTWEMERTGGVFVEQVIRPTGLIDPPVEIRPARSQVDDLLDEVKQVSLRGYRTLITTLTKRMAEDLTEYLHENRRARALHALRDRHDRADGNHPRPAPRRLRRAGRHQPAARRFGHPRMRARRHSRRRQGRVFAQRKRRWSKPSAAPPATSTAK